jgi:hypothetical protein
MSDRKEKNYIIFISATKRKLHGLIYIFAIRTDLF